MIELLRIKKFFCNQCDHKAASSQTLKIHMNNKHSVNPELFSCDTCGKKFKAQHNLRRHCKTVHKLQNCSELVV